MEQQSIAFSSPGSWSNTAERLDLRMEPILCLLGVAPRKEAPKQKHTFITCFTKLRVIDTAVIPLIIVYRINRAEEAKLLLIWHQLIYCRNIIHGHINIYLGQRGDS